jgi:integrase
MYSVKIGHVVRLFGGEGKLSTIDPNLVDWYIGKREEEGAKSNTISKELTALAQMLKLAKRAGCYPHDVRALRPIDFSAGYVPGERVLSEAEIEKLRTTEKAPRFATIYASIATSCRDVELRRLEPQDYDKETGILRIRGTKTEGAERTVPVLSIFRPTFETCVLPHLPLKFKDTSRLISRACKRAGLAHATSNDMRRTCATLMAASGVPFDLAAKIMGHVDSQMLKRVYVKLAPEQLKKAAERHIELVRPEASTTSTPHPGVFTVQFCSGAANENACFSEENHRVSFMYWPLGGTADAGDLKSLARDGVPVRVREGLPTTRDALAGDR